MTGQWAIFDIELTRLSADELRDFIAWSWREEGKVETEAARQYHAVKQEMAWALLFERTRADVVQG